MEDKVCFLFGHATAPDDTLFVIEAAAQRHYLEYGIRTFVVGNRGSFDRYAATAIKKLKRRYDGISLCLLLSYHPAERPVDLLDGFDYSYYPPLEKVPRPYAIVRANQYMIKQADSIICYVKYPGNARKLMEYVLGQKKGRPLDNVAEKTDMLSCQ